MNEKASSRLYMKHEVSTKLHEERKAREAEKMAARAAAEEIKMAARRGKREQQLARRVETRELYQAAKNSESRVADACEALEAAKDTCIGAKGKIETLKIQIQEAKQKAINAQARREAAIQKSRDADSKVSQLEKQLQETMIPTDDTIVEQHSQNLREAWDGSRKAWNRIQRAVFKKDHDRALKKRAKGLLGL